MSRDTLRLPAPWVSVLLQMEQCLSGQGVFDSALVRLGSKILILLQLTGSMQASPHLEFLITQYLISGREQLTQHFSSKFCSMKGFLTTKQVPRASKARRQTNVDFMILPEINYNRELSILKCKGGRHCSHRVVIYEEYMEMAYHLSLRYKSTSMLTPMAEWVCVQLYSPWPRSAQGVLVSAFFMSGSKILYFQQSLGSMQLSPHRP